jgi:hypothetical protein
MGMKVIDGHVLPERSLCGRGGRVRPRPSSGIAIVQFFGFWLKHAHQSSSSPSFDPRTADRGLVFRRFAPPPQMISRGRHGGRSIYVVALGPSALFEMLVGKDEEPAAEAAE